MSSLDWLEKVIKERRPSTWVSGSVPIPHVNLIWDVIKAADTHIPYSFDHDHASDCSCSTCSLINALTALKAAGDL